MTRECLTEKLLDIKREKSWTWKYICGEIGSMPPIVPVVNSIRLASAAESDDPVRDVGFLQNDLMGCRRSISAVGSTGS